MLNSLSMDTSTTIPTRTRTRRLRHVRRAGGWLLLAGWIVLPLMPMLALALSKVLGVEF